MTTLKFPFLNPHPRPPCELCPFTYDYLNVTVCLLNFFIDNESRIVHSVMIQYKKYSNPHLDAFSK